MSEVSRCMLCHDPVCTKACPQKAPVGEILRSMYFENYLGASKKIGKTDCTYCNAPCEKACILSKDSVPVKIRQSIMDMTIGKKHLPEEKNQEVDMSTEICGIKLDNPFLLSSSVVSSRTIVDHQSIERGTIVFPIFNKELCIGCGRCYISCMDGGHQAIEFDPETRKPRLNGSKCVGCHLCKLVCSSGAITAANKAVVRQRD